MGISRRFFVKTGLVSVLPAALKAEQQKQQTESIHAGCLVDTTLCIGCRKCEEACNIRQDLRRPEKPFIDKTVFRLRRRPTEDAYTIVNQYPGSPSPDQKRTENTHCKVQCMHCLTPSCVSACLVGAMFKLEDGSVVYNKDICLGCRYCMVACPFDVPAYEYSDPLTPRVRKCVFCAEYKKNTGADPACAATCPTEALVFGKRQELIELARDRIKRRPDRYVNHIYGESEIGGTSWLYLAGRPLHQIDLCKMPDTSPATITEAIQHGIFKYGLLPVAAYGLLGLMMWHNRRKDNKQPPKESNSNSGGKK